ncbi:MAG: polysaccharide deacetylase family protein [Chloroflexi bacterium]|nr:polysaccharide deacetylase family protein [Chloroflexota bacterium]
MTPRVLMYHSISTRGSGDFEQRYVLPERTFRAHLDLLRVLRIPALPIEALLEAQPRRGVILTFDDAYEDFATTAWPHLRDRGYPAAVMVPTAHVGGRDEWNAGEAPALRPLLTWSALRQLHAEGVAIESHSATHPDLRALPIEQAERELRSSRVRIATELGHPPRFLAYPYNRASPELAQAVDRAGYQGAVCGHWTDDSPFNRRRYDAGCASLPRFALDVLGVADVARRAKRSGRKVVTRVRRDAAEYRQPAKEDVS